MSKFNGDTSSEVMMIPSSQLDGRSDDEIIATLLKYQAITSEKNVWTFWDTGFSEMRPYVRRNIIGWVRRLGPDWTVRVLDHVAGSPLNVSTFVNSTFFPEAFNNGTMSGIYAGVHSADLVRLPLLYLYGGVWMDTGIMLFRSIHDICWRALEDPRTPYEIAGFATGTEPSNDIIMNCFIAAKSGNGFIRRWHDVFLAMWENRTDCKGLHDHPLVRPVKPVQIPKIMQTTFAIDNQLFNDYVAHFLAFKRVWMLEDPADGFNGPRYWENHAFMLPVQEAFLAQQICKFDGQRQFDLLSLQREGLAPADRDQEAETLVQELLTHASTMKLSRGLKNNKLVHLAKLWDLPENSEADVKPGSFGEYLRWGSVHLKQTRTLKPLQIHWTGEVLRAGVTEIVK
ncbi:Uncharacterized protein BP5553_09555 [Venustampulla echinocandica]|uniref:Capsule polysaccharide biosynthesis protein n=1 Tax=Venustampulla echinocandica TaxID=2656787 RepID=A0A370TBD7_9HELO|nr:Uncharacterized protein BP5553_09555 [Venustampulla echinocandica]RDL31346.1 Uncharacterized protein BP5553_09555 [Venustampulla echinocandica]